MIFNHATRIKSGTFHNIFQLKSYHLITHLKNNPTILNINYSTCSSDKRSF
ncbi:hypothetical protein MtrunA17_Chr1g0171631 [Medicago truncatula]|uniref:Uncharacterized protein n=1 Tax=Medicago truncatula TaxID=3880 RepID=A0A396JRV5_MEDTR|nr:hypothetical protein MtrunA17_Chr1g0171631 [Medicago truncatula]